MKIILGKVRKEHGLNSLKRSQKWKHQYAIKRVKGISECDAKLKTKIKKMIISELLVQTAQWHQPVGK